MSKSKPQIGQRRDVGRIDGVIVRIRATTRTQSDGSEVTTPYVIFSWKSEDDLEKEAVSLQCSTFGEDTPDITEITCFNPANDDGLVTAFHEGIFFNPDPKVFDYEKFVVPAIGDYVRLSGIHYEKWTVLAKSPNPRLKKGFWKQCVRCYAPESFLVRRRPPKPSAKKLLKINAV